MTRNEAIALARKHIDACHPGQHKDFEPLEWVVAAILEAAGSAYFPPIPGYVVVQDDFSF